MLINPTYHVIQLHCYSSLDENLPKALLDTTQIILCVIGSILVIAYVNPVFLLPIVAIAAVFVCIRKVYLKTSKTIKRLEAIGELLEQSFNILTTFNHSEVK